MDNAIGYANFLIENAVYGVYIVDLGLQNHSISTNQLQLNAV